MKASLIIEAVDRATRVVDRVKRSASGLTGGLGTLGQAMRRVNAADASFMSRVQGRLADIAPRIKALAGRAGMRGLELGAIGAGRAIGWTIRQVGTLALATAQLAAAGAVFGAGWFIGGVIRTGAEFETMGVQLETLLGSTAAADRALQFIKRFATETPYELDQVTRAFIAAKQNGIDPFSGAMTTIGDAASGLNKDYVEAVLAIGDAQRGQFERLIDMGITGSARGANVALTYINKRGQEVTWTVRRSATTIQREVLSIFSEMYAGGMNKQSRTLPGIWRNLMDKLTNFQLAIADAGIYDNIKSKLQRLLNWLDTEAGNNALAGWADDISNSLERIADKAEELTTRIKWKEVRDGLQGAADAAGNLLEFMVALYRAGQFVSNGLNDIQRRLDALAQYTPINIILRATGAIGHVPAQLSPSARERLITRDQRQRVWSPSLAPARPLLGLPNSGRPAQTPSMARPQASKVAIDINLTGPGARNASVRGIRSEGTDLAASVYRGRAMAGAV